MHMRRRSEMHFNDGTVKARTVKATFPVCNSTSHRTGKATSCLMQRRCKKRSREIYSFKREPYA